MWKAQRIPWLGEKDSKNARSSLLIQKEDLNILCDCPYNWSLCYPNDSSYTFNVANTTPIATPLQHLPSKIHLILISCSEGLLGLPYLSHTIDLSETHILATTPVLQAALPYLSTFQVLGMIPAIQIAPLHNSPTPLPSIPSTLKYPFHNFAPKYFSPNRPLGMRLIPTYESGKNDSFMNENNLQLNKYYQDYRGTLPPNSSSSTSFTEPQSCPSSFPSPVVVSLQTLSFNENYTFYIPSQLVSSYPSKTLTVSPHSSGYSLGGSYWNLKMPSGETLSLIGPISLDNSRYPLSFDEMNLQSCNILCFYDCLGDDSIDENNTRINTHFSTQNNGIKAEKNEIVGETKSSSQTIISPLTYSQNLTSLSNTPLSADEISMIITNLLKYYSSILIPIDWCGILLLELVEKLHTNLSQNLTVDKHLPIYCIYPGSKAYFASLDACSEWMNDPRRECTLSKSPESGFAFTSMIQTNSLILAESLDQLGSSYREPCILFTSSIFLTSSKQFIESKSSSSTISDCTFFSYWHSNPHNCTIQINIDSQPLEITSFKDPNNFLYNSDSTLPKNEPNPPFIEATQSSINFNFLSNSSNQLKKVDSCNNFDLSDNLTSSNTSFLIPTVFKNLLNLKLRIKPNLKDLVDLLKRNQPRRILITEEYLPSFQNFSPLRPLPVGGPSFLFMDDVRVFPLKSEELCKFMLNDSSSIPSNLPESLDELLKNSFPANIEHEKLVQSINPKFQHQSQPFSLSYFSSLQLKTNENEGLTIENLSLMKQIFSSKSQSQRKFYPPNLLFGQLNINSFLAKCNEKGWILYQDSDSSPDCWVFPQLQAKMTFSSFSTEIECNNREIRNQLRALVRSMFYN